MKKTLFITSLLCTAIHLHAEVGDTVNLTQGYVADGVTATFYNGVLTFGKTELQSSTRFYDSQKGWVAGSSYGDSLMCWAHTSSNMIQYWQSYYGVFYKGNKALPYGSDYTRKLYNVMNPSNSPVITDPMRLNVMKALYNSGFYNAGNEVKTGTDWFFTWVDSAGGYYSEYFGTTHQGESTPEGKTATITAVDSLSSLKTALLPALGITQSGNTYTQTEAGLIAHLNVTNGSSPHTLTCYGLTTHADGSIKSLIIADSDDCRLLSYEGVEGSTGQSGTYTPKLTQLYVNKDANGKLALYTDADHTTPFISGDTYYVSGITQINTPEVLQNMLAEYSDVANEAQVWNGKGTAWEQQTATTDELPTESTGWDVHVNGANIATEHHGHYHTYSTNGRAVRFDEHADNRTVTINGTVAASSIEVAAAGYTFKAGENASIQAGADLTLRSMASLNSELELQLNNLTLENEATLAASTTITVKGNFLVTLQQSTTISLLTAAAPGVSIDADLNLSEASSVSIEATVDMNNHTLTLRQGQRIELGEIDGSAPIFANVGTLIIGGQTIAKGTDLTDYLVFLAPDNTELTGVIYSEDNRWVSIPEPTTATLSLLALAALTARRRRH